MFSSSTKAASGNVPAIPDPQFNYVTMLLHGDGTNGAQNNTFVDSSTNNFTITRNGNTTQGSFSPYGSNWGNYFGAANGNALLIRSSGSELTFTGNFTFETWVYPTSGSSSGYSIIFSSNSPAEQIAYYYTDGRIGCYFSNGANGVSSAGKLAMNAWSHIAVVRNASTVKIYVNGVDTGVSISGTINVNVGLISGYQVGATGYNVWGYLSNVRLGTTAVYTSNFTPSTTPLTAISGTVLLTCQSNRYIDNSTTAATITTVGTPSVQRFNPFGTATAYSTSVIGGSGYFDGSGDSLNCVANSTNNPQSGDDYCVEAWIYLTAAGNVTSIYSGDSSGYFAYRSVGRFEFVSGGLELRLTYTAPLYRWCHVAVTRQSGTVRMFVDGVLTSPTVSSGTVTGNTDVLLGSSTTYYFGSYTNATSGPFWGYMSGFRIVKGSAVYTSTFTPPTTPPTAITNTAILLNYTNGAIFDNAMMNDLETVGNAQISTSVKKFGTGSMYFDGTGDGLKAIYTPNFAFSTGDFTIELWLYINSTSGTPIVFDMRDGGGSQTPVIYMNGSALVYYTNAGVRITGGTLSTGTWYHIAVCRSGTSTKMFLDGTQIGSTYTDSTNYAGGNLWLGSYSSGGYDLNGYIDDLRITKGYARYTANFTPPTAAFSDTGP